MEGGRREGGGRDKHSSGQGRGNLRHHNAYQGSVACTQSHTSSSSWDRVKRGKTEHLHSTADYKERNKSNTFIS